MIDLDDFKLYNDTYGHKTGDKVLIELAGACERALRDNILRKYSWNVKRIFL